MINHRIGIEQEYSADQLISDFLGTEPFHTSYTREGNISSTYWDLGGYIYRLSDHWGYVAKCIWLHNGEGIYNGRKGYLLGRCDLNSIFMSTELQSLIYRIQ